MDKEIIYHVMNGDINLPADVLTDEMIVEDEFGEGRECGQLYNEVYQARRRLEEKLDVEGKEDVERIIDYMGSISKIFSMKMYDYGMEERKLVTIHGAGMR